MSGGQERDAPYCVGCERLLARLDAERERAESFRSALDHIEVATREDMQGFYGYPRTSAADSANKIAKCALAAASSDDREAVE